MLEGDPHCFAPAAVWWNKIAPSKTGFFAWEAFWGKVLTTTQLKGRVSS